MGIPAHAAINKTLSGCLKNENSVGNKLPTLPCFDSVESHRVRVGTRLTHADSDKANIFAGVAYEHEFDGKANATWQGFRLPTPTVKGGTTIGELGVSVKAGKAKIDASIQGYGGRRKGAGMQIGIKF